jgi:CheY-like chemotaxis protein
VESEGIENKGSTFIILLPIQRTAPKQGQPSDTGSPPRALRPLVLVATSNAESRRMVAQYLAGIGYGVAVASGANDVAIALSARRPYAVVIESGITDQIDARNLGDLSAAIPRSVPTVAFSAEPQGRLGFCLLNGEGRVVGPLRGRLIDALRQTDSTGKEVKTVLVIDDESAFLELLTKTFLSKGFQVLTASNGRQGLEYATRHHPDVIVLDLNMPDFHGTQVVEQLRVNASTKHIPILIHTGCVLSEDERQRLATHVQSITSKTEPQRLFVNVEHLGALNNAFVETGALS